MINVLAAGVAAALGMFCIFATGCAVGSATSIAKSPYSSDTIMRGAVALAISGSMLIAIAGLLLMAR